MESVGIGVITALAVALIVTAIGVIIAMAATTWKSTAAMLRASAMLAFCLAPVWFPAASSFLACTEIQHKEESSVLKNGILHDSVLIILIPFVNVLCSQNRLLHELWHDCRYDSTQLLFVETGQPLVK